jgi:tRNA pseudouridine55 synthase
MPDGLLVVYKPAGCSSHDVIAKIRKVYKVKCGHAGTLDPMAQGVLLVFMNRALKLLNFISAEHLDKTYLMRVTLGATTDSYDATGKFTNTFNGPIEFSSDQLINILRKFVGVYDQVPPAFSAIKVGGRRAYALARAGEDVKLKSRRVHVSSIRVVEDFMLNNKRNLVLRVHCSRGTYIRSIAHDLGQELGCGGYLSYLLRERVGKWAFTQAFPYWKIEDGEDFTNSDSFIDFAEILPFPRLRVNVNGEERAKNGLSIGFKDVCMVEGDNFSEGSCGIVQIFNSGGKLVALYEPSRKNPGKNKNQAQLRPVRVFPENES